MIHIYRQQPPVVPLNLELIVESIFFKQLSDCISLVLVGQVHYCVSVRVTGLMALCEFSKFGCHILVG